MTRILTLIAALAGAPDADPSAPIYRIYPLRNGRCAIAGNHAFFGGKDEETYEYALYIWLVLGGEKPILVDAGLSDVAEMNRGAAHVLRKPIVQSAGESSRAQLARFGLTPEDIGHVFITHLHFDHVDDLPLYKDAKVYVGRREWRRPDGSPPVWAPARILRAFSESPGKERLVLVDDQEVLPGIESFRVGGHTPGSMAYRVRTAHGWAVLTGDTVSLLANIERDTPVGVHDDLDECRAALGKVRDKATIVLPSHDPGTPRRWPPLPAGTPRRTIRAIKVGQCEVRDYITFQDSDARETRTFFLYVWAIEGGARPIIVDTGPRDPEGFSRGTAEYIPGGVKQAPGERTIEALRANGIDAAAASHVIATHLHADHYDYFDAFPNARLVIDRIEYEGVLDRQTGKPRIAETVAKALADRPDALRLADGDEEIEPGVRVVRLGCHTSGSQGVLVQTFLGPVLIAGDVVYRYENIEEDRPIRSPDPRACREAMARIRTLADIVLPAHDPRTLVRWPGGVIGAPGGAP